MGSYIYRRTPKTIKAITPNGKTLLINTYIYYTKPYWNLWDDAQLTKTPSWLDKYDKKIVKQYKLNIGQQDSLFYACKMTDDSATT